MRIVNKSLERTSAVRDDPSKLFLMMEGIDTEPIYFKEFFLDRKDILYLPFERDVNDLGWSNPYLLMTQLKLELQCGLDKISYADFMPFLVRYLKDNNTELNVSLFKKEFNNCLTKNHILPSHLCSESVIKQIFETLKTTSFVELVYKGLDDIKESFSSLVENHYYDKEVDEIALVVDRDKYSFSKSQYDKVVKDGKEKGILVFVTNPCFEFFLSLHLSDMRSINKSALLNNSKTNGITFAHSELLKLDPTYKKEEFDAANYISNIQTAITNLSFYEQRIEKLENNVGSNLAFFLKKYLK